MGSNALFSQLTPPSSQSTGAPLVAVPTLCSPLTRRFQAQVVLHTKVITGCRCATGIECVARRAEISTLALQVRDSPAHPFPVLARLTTGF